MRLQGIFAALATPFDYKGEIYKVKVQHNVDKWNRVGLAGYAVATRIGEGGLLTFEERVELFKLVKDAAAPERVLLADVTREGVKESLMLAECAAEIGYQGVCVAACRLMTEVSSPLPVVTELPVLVDSAGELWAHCKKGSAGVRSWVSPAPRPMRAWRSGKPFARARKKPAWIGRHALSDPANWWRMLGP